jgi:hypothetical protein
MGCSSRCSPSGAGEVTKVHEPAFCPAKYQHEMSLTVNAGKKAPTDEAHHGSRNYKGGRRSDFSLRRRISGTTVGHCILRSERETCQSYLRPM